MSIKARSADTGGAFGLVEAHFPEGFGPPLHVHSREDEGFYILEGRVRFRQGEEDFVAGPGTFVWGPRGIPHAFKVEPGGARALIVAVPAGFEGMFEEGGVPARQGEPSPVVGYDPTAAKALAERFAFEVVGPQLQ